MKRTLKISLRANEKIYINGAVIKADRKVSLELLNDVHFLLESHVLQADEATTPLKQLYFVLQVMLMNPDGAEEARTLFRQVLPNLLSCFRDQQIIGAVKDVDRLVGEGQIYEALKAIRGLYPREEEILARDNQTYESRFALAAGG